MRIYNFILIFTIGVFCHGQDDKGGRPVDFNLPEFKPQEPELDKESKGLLMPKAYSDQFIQETDISFFLQCLKEPDIDYDHLAPVWAIDKKLKFESTTVASIYSDLVTMYFSDDLLRGRVLAVMTQISSHECLPLINYCLFVEDDIALNTSAVYGLRFFTIKNPSRKQMVVSILKKYLKSNGPLTVNARVEKLIDDLEG